MLRAPLADLVPVIALPWKIEILHHMSRPLRVLTIGHSYSIALNRAVDAACWADCIRKVLNDPQIRKELAVRGLKRVKRYSAATIASQYKDIYRHLAEHPKVPRQLGQTCGRAPIRILTIAHSYCVSLNRRLIHELARAGDGRYCVTAVAPTRLYSPLGKLTLDVEPEEPGDLEAVSARLSRVIHLMFYAPRLRQILKRQWDLIHCWEEPYILAGAEIAAFAREKTPLVYYTHQNINKWYPPPFAQFERYCLERCTAWIAGGQTVQETLVERGYGRRKHCIVPLGVDTTVFSAQHEVRRTMFERFEWDPNGPPVVGYCGRFVSEKGILLMMRALDSAKTPWRALFVGGGPLEAQLRRWGIKYGNRVRVMTGVSHVDVPAALNAMDVMCAPSQTTRRWREQFGRMLIEAFACGVPVVASNSGEIPFVVGEAGVIVEEQDCAAWAREIESLLGAPERRRVLAALALDHVKSRYAWPVVARQTLDFFAQLL